MLLNNDVVVTDGWLGRLISLASSAVSTESDLDANRRVFTTEITEITEIDTGMGERFSEGRDVYRGRDITVINAPPGTTIQSATGGTICRSMRKIRNRWGWLGRCRLCGAAAVG